MSSSAGRIIAGQQNLRRLSRLPAITRHEGVTRRQLAHLRNGEPLFARGLPSALAFEMVFTYWNDKPTADLAVNDVLALPGASDISHMTFRRVLNTLADQGFIDRQAGQTPEPHTYRLVPPDRLPSPEEISQSGGLNR